MKKDEPMSTPLHRRRFLQVCSAAGVGAVMTNVLWAAAAQRPIDDKMIDDAAALADVTILPEQKKAMLDGLRDQRAGFAKIRALSLGNATQPAAVFAPLASKDVAHSPSPVPRPALPKFSKASDLAFASALELGEAIRQKKISSLALTEMYIERLQRHDAALHCLVTITKERALAQAKEADKDIAAGKWRGPLHGVPWGGKDLLAVKGYPTTWGAHGFEKQTFDEDATVVQRLDAAGAVLIAKLSLGALAMNDRWFGGQTKSPWNTNIGSSGSSAGSGAAVAAGLVGFALGSETLGSIVAPSSRCGVTGLRPTFGRVPRTGAMALAYSMDKLGPICRTVTDAQVVLSIIAGPDAHDFSAADRAYAYEEVDFKKLRVAYFKDAFDTEPPYDKPYSAKALEALRALGVTLDAVTVPDFPYDSLIPILMAESAAAFDDLTRSGRDQLLQQQTPNDWPNLFRVARLLPAVEYVQATRARRKLMEQADALFAKYDVIVAPSNGVQLVMTNFTGHPAVIVPSGVRGKDAPMPKDDDSFDGPGIPTSLTFLGRTFGEAAPLALAKAYQDRTGWHLKTPPAFAH